VLHTPDQLAPTGDRSAPPPHARHPFLPMAEARGLLDETPMTSQARTSPSFPQALFHQLHCRTDFLW
jgi:hypothetical protein